MKPQTVRWEVGRELPAVECGEVTHAQLVRYSGASGDFNPIHTVAHVAEQAGLGGVIAHGMLIMGMAGRAVCSWFPRKSLRRFRARFTAITRPGEVIVVTGRVAKRVTAGEERRLRCEVTAANRQGEVKLRGEFEVAEEELDR